MIILLKLLLQSNIQPGFVQNIVFEYRVMPFGLTNARIPTHDE